MKLVTSFRKFDTYSKKRVSYILISKERPTLLEKSLNGIRPLLGSNDELILIANGSANSVRKIVRKYIDIIDKCVLEPDISAGHAANKGILLATGKYIKFLTDDDVIYKNGMEKAVLIMDGNTDVDVLLCGGTMYNTKLRSTKTFYMPPGSNYGLNIDDVFIHGTNGMGLIVRRSSIAKTGLFPLDAISDISFLLNCILIGANVKFCRIMLYHQIVRANTINQKYRREINSKVFALTRRYASKQYLLRYELNWFLLSYPQFKVLFYVPIFIIQLVKRLVLKKGTDKVKFLWDAGFS
jgi:glycosyltransferase involved in cell wall biosynthesis